MARKAYKILNIINHQGNARENHGEMPFHTHRDGCGGRREVGTLARCWWAVRGRPLGKTGGPLLGAKGRVIIGPTHSTLRWDKNLREVKMFTQNLTHAYSQHCFS